MDAAAEIRRTPVSTRFSLSMETSRLTRDGFAELVSRDQILRCERGQRNIQFSCSADHEQIGHLTRLILRTVLNDPKFSCKIQNFENFANRKEAFFQTI